MTESAVQLGSPLAHLFPEGVTTADIGPVTVVWDFGDLEAEYEAIRQSAARIDLSGAGIVHVTGDGAYDLLQGALARDLEFVTPEQSLISALLDEDAGIVSIVTVYHIDEGFRLETGVGGGPATAAHLSALADGVDDVDVSPANDVTTIILIEGPQAAAVLEVLVDPDLGALPLSGLMPVEFGGVDIVVSRTGFTGEYGYKLFVPTADAATVWTGLESITPVGVGALEVAMFEVRQPLTHHEIAAGATALESGYAWLIDITKEEFTGREAVVAAFEAGSRALVVGWVAPAGTAPVPVGTVVSIGAEKAGTVVHSVFSPGRKELIGLAQLEPGLVAPHLDVTVEAPDGPLEAVTIPAPYVVPASWKTR